MPPQFSVSCEPVSLLGLRRKVEEEGHFEEEFAFPEGLDAGEVGRYEAGADEGFEVGVWKVEEDFVDYFIC